MKKVKVDIMTARDGHKTKEYSLEEARSAIERLRSEGRAISSLDEEGKRRVIHGPITGQEKGLMVLAPLVGG
jgi:hypothetical protein